MRSALLILAAACLVVGCHWPQPLSTTAPVKAAKGRPHGGVDGVADVRNSHQPATHDDPVNKALAKAVSELLNE